jgi:hypothetical protein
MKSGCKEHSRFLVQEGFSTNFDDSKKYFNNLLKKCNSINDNITLLSTKTDDLEIKFSGLEKDICYVTKQIDEGLQGNYASNVPEDERLFPLEEQNKRAKERRKNSIKYLTNLKKTFVKTHNNIPLLECFTNSGMTDEQEAELKIIRDNLSERIEEVKANLSQFDQVLLNLQKGFAKNKLQKYYTTLNFNDKYIKQMNRIIANGGEEGYANKDDDSELLDFRPIKQKFIEYDPETGIEQRINSLEENYNKSASIFNNLSKTFIKYNNTTKLQASILKNAKNIITDKDEQTKKINENIVKAVKA